MKFLFSNPTLLSIVAEGFLSRLSFGLISFALPLYARHLGMSLTEIGILISLNTAVAIGLKPATGWLADRFGLKRTFTSGVCVRSLVSLLLAFAVSPWQLFAIRAAHGVSASLRDPSVNTLIAEHGGKKTIASSFAWYQTAKTMAGSLGKAGAGIALTLTASDFSLVFIIAFFLSVFPLLVVIRYVRDKSGKEDKAAVTEADIILQDEEARTQADKRGRQPSLVPFVGFGFLISGTAQMLHDLFPILATEYVGLTEAETGLIYLASTIVIMASGPLFGWLSDNFSHKFVLSVRGFANIFSSILYISAPYFSGITAAKVLDDAGKSAFRPAWGALMAHVSSFNKQRRARTISYMSIGEDAGTIAGPIFAGFLWNGWGITTMFCARIALAVVTEACAFMLTKSLPNPSDDHSSGDSERRKYGQSRRESGVKEDEATT